jgi:hypothetical protein
MHKLAYTEFSQDGGRLLKFVKHFSKLSEQLNAFDNYKNMKLSIPLVSLKNTDNKTMCCHCPLINNK